MSQIEFVVLSDLHLGAENSLLTNLKIGGYQTDTLHPSPVMIKLVECLREVLKQNNSSSKPKLVLNGDLMELALTSMNDASMAFQRFIELTMPEDESMMMFDKEIIFLAGNHDHNIWESSRYSHFIKLLGGMKPGEKIEQLVHVTKMFEVPPMTSELLTSLVQMYPHMKERGVNIKTAYPAFAHLHNQKDKCVIFSHGHFIESMYSIMTSLDEMLFPDRPRPTSLNDIETQNFAWIDFFWSTMGRSGIVGRDIQLLYDKMQDNTQVERIIDTFAKSIAMKKKNCIIRWLEYKVLKEVMQLTIVKQASKEKDQEGILTSDCLSGLKRYMEVYIRNQLEFELNSNIPSDITFLFGHTHKPFLQFMDFIGFNGKVKVINSGGWVVDTTDTMPFHGGSILLVDENLDTVSLNMYKEGKYKPGFEVSTSDNDWDKNELYKCLEENLDFNKEPWSGFERMVEIEVNLRHEYLKEIIKSDSI